PDTLIYNLNDNKNDYNDDYKSRTEYTNYLIGNPFGPNINRNVSGLGIPIDLSMAFHTDAGITRNDTTVGTLAIYSLIDAYNNKTFPDGKSRLACRDLTDIIQTEIVDDIKENFDIAWNKRQLREAQYAESQRPNVPAILLELLSHQNFLDMKYMLDPRFRFIVSRSIYKGMLKFLSVTNNFDYVVQPLPINNFALNFVDNDKIYLSWNFTEDKSEPTAIPTGYIVYTATNNNGFDNGIFVKNNNYIFNKPEKNVIYRFKITAVNEGGESFPSEELSACKSELDKTVLIVNKFNRISAPKWIDGEKFSGFLSNLDAGVPDKVDLGFTGYQTDFNPKSPYVSNDEPGHGSSTANFETKVIAGNTFNYAYSHGEAFVKNGYSYISCSDEAFESGLYNNKNFEIIDIIVGEEKATPYPKKYENETKGVQFKIFTKSLQKQIEEYLSKGGNLLISGAYIASDIFRSEYSDSNDIKFALNKLKYNIASGYASKTGLVKSVNKFSNISFCFNTELNDKLYAVESPDALLPVNGSKTIMRYIDNDYSAAIGYKNEYGIIALGFPFETILGSDKRAEIIKSIVNYFQLKK
nr:N-acetylmuramoyl-L-alanine amidase [Melioribacteraceae bacterium]